MKKLKIYFILLLLSGFSSVFAQATRSETPVNAPSGNSLHDPKLSPEEQAVLLTAGVDNPAKIDEPALVDPKINPEDLATEEDYGISNAKPAEGHEADPKLVQEQVPEERQAEPATASKPVSGTDQPVGEKSESIPDYRNSPTGGNDQPRGNEAKNIPDYREMHGSGQQPPGDK